METSIKAKTWLAFILVAAAAGWAGCTRGTGPAAPQMTESAPAMQAHVLHDGNGASSAPTFLLPAANQGFVGTWGGHLSVDPSQTKLVGDPVMPASYYFGVMNGTIYLRTEVYGNAAWPVVRSSVKLLDPSRVRFQLDSLCSTCKPQCREVEVTTLKLAGDKTLDVEVDGYAYWHGDGRTMVNYHGTLHPADAQQIAAIDSEVKRNHVLLTKINASRGTSQ
ncbi:MAG TPA: hypothetical protein VMV27_13070 [Candidatus Binataceae bacterium]|nr:hypothetical protein [Candidatus Binataceae bacterium]